MMNDSGMKEAKDGIAVLKEVECEIFTAFCEYAYTGSYRVPRVTVDFEQSSHASPLYQSTKFGRKSSVMDHETEVAVPVAPVEESALESAQEIETWASWGSSKKDKKKSLRKRPALAVDEEAHQSNSDTSEKHHDRLWNAFCNLTYEYLPPPSDEMQEDLNRVTEVEFKPLLFHCKLNVFAQMYLVVSLEQLTLRKLHAALEGFHLDLVSSNEVLEVIEFAFTNTERGDDHDDELRKLLVAYAASQTKILKQNASFRTLLDAHGELGSDIVQALG